METSQSQANIAGDRSEIGGYEVLRTLLPEQSWLASAPGGRRVVLKTLDEDCLWKGQLHPNVKDRLGRVRELAHSGVANLYGVERDGGLTYLVWEYVAGQTLEERAASKSCGQRDLMVLARELVLAVEMLHARGIVHGALKASNVIVDAEGRAILTHVSPLLYTEPTEDVSQVVGLLWGLVEKRGETDSPLGRLLDEMGGAEEVSLRRLAGRLGALIEARESGPAAEGEDEADRFEAKAVRRRALLGAGATAVLGVMLFFGLRQYANARTPKAPVPPQASPAALQPGSAASGQAGERASASAGGVVGVSRRVGP